MIYINITENTELRKFMKLRIIEGLYVIIGEKILKLE